MDPIRRNILLGASGMVGSAALGAPFARATTGAAAGATNPVRLLSTYVAGTAYHDSGDAVAALGAGRPVTLWREADNDYDSRAIAVRTDSGTKLGYVPRADNAALASLMDAGFQVTARVHEVLPDGRQPDIRLDVYLTF